MTKTNGKSPTRNIDPKKYPIEVLNDWVVMIFQENQVKTSLIMPDSVKDKKRIALCVAVGPDADISMLGKCVFFNYATPFTEVTYDKQSYATVRDEDMQGVFVDK